MKQNSSTVLFVCEFLRGDNRGVINIYNRYRYIYIYIYTIRFDTVVFLFIRLNTDVYERIRTYKQCRNNYKSMKKPVFTRVSGHGMFALPAAGPAKSAVFQPFARKRLASFDRKDPFLNDYVLQAVRVFFLHLSAFSTCFRGMVLMCEKRILTY